MTTAAISGCRNSAAGSAAISSMYSEARGGRAAVPKAALRECVRVPIFAKKYNSITTFVGFLTLHWPCE